MKNIIGLLSLSCLMAAGLTACGGGSENLTPAIDSTEKQQPNQPTEPSKPVEPEQPQEPEKSTGAIEGLVSSAITDTDTCQLYLYDDKATKFADAFDPLHTSFKQPDTAIVGSAPLATAKVSQDGKYAFTDISTGDYQLVLNPRSV